MGNGKAGAVSWFRFVPALIGFLLPVLAPCSGRPPDLTLDEICRRMQRTDEHFTKTLHHYVVEKRYVLKNERHPKQGEMVVRVYYNSPGRKRIEVISMNAGGLMKRAFDRLVKAEIEASEDGVREQARFTVENYQFRLLGKSVENGRWYYVLYATPKRRNKFMVEGRIWVDAQDFAITRLEGDLAKSPSFWLNSTTIEHRYKKFGDYWMIDTTRSMAESTLFGLTELNVDYREYTINGMTLGKGAGGAKQTAAD